eukprot:3894666-Lingulodinium_polyedra.AAC.1
MAAFVPPFHCQGSWARTSTLAKRGRYRAAMDAGAAWKSSPPKPSWATAFPGRILANVSPRAKSV